MNKLAVVLIALSSMLTSSAAIAQTYDGNLSLTSQTQVDTFGAFGYSEVTGSLTIRGTNIVNLDPLSGLTTVRSSCTYKLNSRITKNFYWLRGTNK
jgi:hypothetical protein